MIHLGAVNAMTNERAISLPNASADALNIRPADPADCRAVARVHVASWRAAYRDIMPATFLAALSIDEREAMWRRLVVTQPGHLLVACNGDAVVGFVAFGECHDEASPVGRAEIWAIYVDPPYWSAGAGRALMHAALTRLNDAGVRDVVLWVLADNKRAIALYERAGFVRDADAVKRIDVAGVLLEEVRYVRGMGERGVVSA